MMSEITIASLYIAGLITITILLDLLIESITFHLVESSISKKNFGHWRNFLIFFMFNKKAYYKSSGSSNLREAAEKTSIFKIIRNHIYLIFYRVTKSCIDDWLTPKRPVMLIFVLISVLFFEKSMSIPSRAVHFRIIRQANQPLC